MGEEVAFINARLELAFGSALQNPHKKNTSEGVSDTEIKWREPLAHNPRKLRGIAHDRKNQKVQKGRQGEEQAPGRPAADDQVPAGDARKIPHGGLGDAVEPQEAPGEGILKKTGQSTAQEPRHPSPREAEARRDHREEVQVGAEEREVTTENGLENESRKEGGYDIQDPHSTRSMTSLTEAASRMKTSSRRSRFAAGSTVTILKSRGPLRTEPTRPMAMPLG